METKNEIKETNYLSRKFVGWDLNHRPDDDDEDDDDDDDDDDYDDDDEK